MFSESMTLSVMSVVLTVAFAVAPALVLAHCDTMDGPVVQSAQRALETGDVTPVLLWVPAKDEPEIREVFQKALSVRKLNKAAADIADMYFFETLVRVHRAGEGEPYAGIQPAGTDPGAAVKAADRSLESGSVEPVLKMMTEALTKGIRERYEQALHRQKHAGDSVEAGRKFVGAYVEYVHYVEALYDLASQGPGRHGEPPEASGHRH